MDKIDQSNIPEDKQLIDLILEIRLILEYRVYIHFINQSI